MNDKTAARIASQNRIQLCTSLVMDTLRTGNMHDGQTGHLIAVPAFASVKEDVVVVNIHDYRMLQPTLNEWNEAEKESGISHLVFIHVRTADGDIVRRRAPNGEMLRQDLPSNVKEALL